MNNSTKSSFAELIEKYKYIRIPKIQRDYAQGRVNDKVNEIRKRFVHVLMRVVKGEIQEQELDFLYGSISDRKNEESKRIKAFEPLDGQQRLTTLFLLHWMMGSKILVTEDAHSVFTYETRPSSKEFCNELVLHQAVDYVKEAKAKDKEKKVKPSEIIMGKDWFKWGWKFDPTIQSTLVMIDAIYDEMPDTPDLEMYRNNLNKITFKILNLEELKASDELFVKMNARGKHLSNFDILKSTLEEEIQMQRQEEIQNPVCHLANQKDEEEWRSLMDGKWIDMFWNKYAKDIVEEENRKLKENEQDLFADDVQKECLLRQAKENKLKAATEAEANLRRLLIRLIALQLLENKNTPGTLKEASYYVDEKDLDNIIYKYDDHVVNVRQHPKEISSNEDLFRIDFRQLIADMNSIIYKDCGDITEILGGILLKKSEDPNNSTDTELLLNVFLKEKQLGNDIELIFYAVLLYLRQYHYCENDAWSENFKEWAHVVRNLFLNVNRNQRIDKRSLMEEAMDGIKTFVSQFGDFILERELNVNKNSLAVRQFIGSLKKLEKNEKGGFSGIENQALNEEIEKAQLKIENSSWVDAIEKAESHPYLWGQISCLLSWAEGDVNLFNDYSCRLQSLLSKEALKNYYPALLCVAPECWKNHSNRLYEYNKDRSNSIKRCLRDNGDRGLEDAYLGMPQKLLVDEWRKEEYKQLSVNDFLLRLQQDSKEKAPEWVYFILYKTATIDYSWRKKVFENEGHIILAQLQTVDSHCLDPILKSIHLMTGGSKENFGDSKSSDGHFVKFDHDSCVYRIEWCKEQNGMYILKKDGEPDKIMSADQIREFASDIMLSPKM